MLLKSKPEDFVVEEIPLVEPAEGPYCYFWMEKKEYNTLDALQTLADKLRIPLKRIGYAGNKDRQAVTKQLCSVQLPWSKLASLQLKDIKLSFYGQGKDPLSLGMLKGNKFTIIVREITTLPKRKKQFINYFGEQRFHGNVEIGRAIIKKDFQKAAMLSRNENVQSHLKQFPKDAIGALRTLPKKMLQLYIHAYQSWMWNLVASRVTSPHIPLVGYGTTFENEEITHAYEEIMGTEGITKRDFIIKQIPDLSSEGALRDRMATAHDLHIEKKDETFKITFWLEKGCYATVFIDQLFS